MKEIEVFEGERATKYDSFISDFFPSYNLVMDTVPKLLEGYLNEEKESKILVVGCGTGNETKQLLDYNKNWTVDACDPSEEMIEIAKSKLKGYSNVKLIHNTIAGLESTNKYDAATLFLVLHFISDDGAKLKLLKQIAKKLKKGGKFVLFDICGTKKELKQNFEILSHLLPKDWTKEGVEQRRNRILNDINAISEKRCKILLKKSGFKKVVKFHQSTICRGWIMNKK